MRGYGGPQEGVLQATNFRGAVAATRPATWAALGALGLCIGVTAALGLYQLGNRPLLEGEARYALIGREMRVSGDWVQPRLNDVRYYEKPPLLYWAIATAQEAYGSSEFASRLPSLLSHVGTVAVVYLIALALIGSGAALRAGLIYATAVGPFIFARAVFPDAPLTFFLSVTLLGLVLAADGRWPRLGPLLLYVGAACAGLTKGLVGLVVPVSVVGLYTVFADRTLVRRLRPGLGLAVFALVFVPWHAMLAWRDPAFLPFYLLNEHLYRFLNIRDPIDYTPMSVVGFWLATLFWLLPWSLFLPPALARGRAALRPLAIPLLWAGFVLGFFTLAQSRLEKYGLPALPALAVVVAAWWPERVSARGRRWSLVAPAMGLVALGVLFVAVGYVLPVQGGPLKALVAQLDGYYREHPDDALLFARQATDLARPFSILLLGAGIATLVAGWTQRTRAAFGAWALGFALVLPFVSRGTQLLGDDRSQRTAMKVVRAHWVPDARLIVDGIYEQTMSLSFYADRPVTVLEEGEHADLLFGRRQGDAPDLFMSHADMAQQWDDPGRIFLVSAPENYPPGATVIFKRPTFAVVTNHPLPAPSVPSQNADLRHPRESGSP